MPRLTMVLFVAVLGTPIHGQSVGADLSGVVSDASGAPLAGVRITLTNTFNGRSETLVTDGRGDYRAVALQPAPYTLVAELDGFERFTRDIALSVGSEATVDIRLIVAGVRESVIVQPAQPSLEVARHEPSSLVTEEQIRVLPEIGRNFLVLAQLLPGSAPLNASVTRFATTKFGGAADQRSSFTTLIDGGDVDDAQWGSPTINLTQESVQEFKVFRSQFAAEYGNALNAVVSVVTRSGGNRLDGSAFYFGRDEALNARYPFYQTKTPFEEWRLGGTIGGPVARDRTHFFATSEFDAVETARIVANPASSPFAARENGAFPASFDDRMAVMKLDHRFSERHTAFARYAYDNQSYVRFLPFPMSDSSQIDTFSRAHSLVAEDAWVLSPRTVNIARVHWFSHASGGDPHHATRPAGEIRPTISIGLFNGGEWIDFARTEVALADTMYATRASHDLKLGGEVSLGENRLQGHLFQDGLFQFSTDAAFNPADNSTWPLSFLQGSANVETYRAHQFALFVQDDWRAADRVRLNLGLRYDLDPTLRINDFYAKALQDPTLAGLNSFVGNDRGTDTNNLQPRIGATFDVRGNGTMVVRGGWGMYVARNRPWFQVRSMDQLGAEATLVEDPQRLRLYPDTVAILAGGGARQLGTVIPDDFVHAYAMNSSAGVGWQLGGAASLDVDYIHSAGRHQVGTTDRNLPASGRISAANPRPVPRFGQVAMLENFTRSSYDALEAQWRTRFRNAWQAQISYTLSRSYLDGVDFFLTQRGTQRTPQERGYSPSDQRHNVAAAVSAALPARFQVAAILKLISGSPMPVQTGTELDGDGSRTGDRPAGLPITVGRNDTQEALALINQFRASVGRGPVDESLLRLDPYRALDVRLTRTFPLGATRRLELLIEAFNVANYVNYVPTVVIRNMNSAQFLARTGARDARQVQWGARLMF